MSQTRSSIAIAIALAATVGLVAIGLTGAGQKSEVEIRPLAAVASDYGHLSIPELGVDAKVSNHTFEIVNSATGGQGGAGAGKATFSPLVIKKRVDTASPSLFQAVASGEHATDATLTVYKKGSKKEEYIVYELKEVLVSSYKQSGNGDDSETLTLTFQSVTVKVGSSSACWDLALNKAC